jgi:hypothetical protein
MIPNSDLAARSELPPEHCQQGRVRPSRPSSARLLPSRPPPADARPTVMTRRVRALRLGPRSAP